jgi:hypothetical protein
MSRAEKQPLFDECGPFAVVPVWLLSTPGLTDRALRLYLVLWSYTTEGNRTAFPSRRTIGAQMGCGQKKVDQAVTELVAAGGLTITPQYRPGTGERSSNLYEPIRTERAVAWCSGCGHTRNVGCKCSPPGLQLNTTWRANGYDGGSQMAIAEEEPVEVEPAKESHIPPSSDSQASSRREGRLRRARNLPFDADFILDLMRQMSIECYHENLSDVTDTNFADIKKATIEVAEVMRRHNTEPDPAYIHGFAHCYQGFGFSNFSRPAPKSYAIHWSKVDWSDELLRREIDEWRKEEEEKPNIMHWALELWERYGL